MILDKLIEKKDITTWAALRVKHLRKQKAKVPEQVERSKREKARQKLKGRIKEAKHIKRLAENKRIKERSKKLFDKVGEHRDHREEVDS